MRLPNNSFHVNSVPTFSVGRFFAQARIFQVHPATHEQIEIFAAIHLPDFAAEAEAITFSNKWAIEWIHENLLEITAAKGGIRVRVTVRNR
jgi:hypothetical protein